jgi:hypothetical protein
MFAGANGCRGTCGLRPDGIGSDIQNQLTSMAVQATASCVMCDQMCGRTKRRSCRGWQPPQHALMDPDASVCPRTWRHSETLLLQKEAFLCSARCCDTHTSQEDLQRWCAYVATQHDGIQAVSVGPVCVAQPHLTLGSEGMPNSTISLLQLHRWRVQELQPMLWCAAHTTAWTRSRQHPRC